MEARIKMHNKMIVGDFCLKETPYSEVAFWLPLSKPRYNELILTVPRLNLPRFYEYFVLSLAVSKNDIMMQMFKGCRTLADFLFYSCKFFVGVKLG